MKPYQIPKNGSYMTEVEKKHYKKMVEWAVGTHFQASLVETSEVLLLKKHPFLVMSIHLFL